MDRSAVLLMLSRVPVIVSATGAETIAVGMGNVAVADPAGTVTVAGTAPAGLLPVSVTTSPAGTTAGESSVTVPTAGKPPVTLPGATVSDRIRAACTDNFAV